jgi:outer membrane receptor protein involved in Fe transport
MNRNLYTLGRVSALLIAGSAAIFAQGTQTASVTGKVNTAAGAPVAGARIILSSPALMGERTLTTDANGNFAARLLPPGAYTISIVKEGFQTIKVREKLGIDQNYQPRIVLPEVQGAVVQVVATSAGVDKTDVKTATNYTLDQVDKLPTANRSQETVALLTPGVVTGVGGRVQIRGAMTSGNLYMVDGQNVTDNTYGNRGNRLIEDSLEETQVITGAISAEYGNVEGGVINSVTRSGSNEFTGQIRWELSSGKWNATQPGQVRSEMPDQTNQTRTFSAGGYLWKDRVWFYTSYFTRGTSAADSVDSSAAGEPGANYAYSIKEIRRQLKLTAQLTQDHTLVASYNNSQNAELNRDYGVGELSALIPQSYRDHFWNVALRSVWGPRFTTDIRYGEKSQKYVGGGSGSQSPISNDDDGLLYGGGIFNSTDGGDRRKNNTFGAKGSLFLDLFGNHQLDFGYDYYEGIRQARNDQSPTGAIFEVANLDYANRTATPVAAWIFQSFDGSANNYTHGLYFNDKWSINNNLSLQVGLRWDKYEAKNSSAKTAGADGLSPRLGVKYDLNGDSKWVFGASWSRYNGKVLESITNSVSNQGNPIEIDWYAKAPYDSQSLSWAQIQDRSIYDIGNPKSVAWANNPTLNVKLSPDMKAPHVDETQVSAAYSYDLGGWGNGFVRLTAVRKSWSDIIDYTIGLNGISAADPETTVKYYNKVWNNQPAARRDYKDLEFDGSWNKGAWSATGNITWASLKGNFEGEGSSTPGRGEGVNAWNVLDTYNTDTNGIYTTVDKANVYAFDKSWTTPDGYLSGHQPLRIRGTLNYTLDWALGSTSFGAIYRFDSGSHFSISRKVPRAQWSADLPSEVGANLVQYKDQSRGAGIFNSVAYTDVAVTHDLPVYKVAGRPVRIFAKVVIQNLWNHQQDVTWATTYRNNGAKGNALDGNPYSLATPFYRGANYGAVGISNFGIARTINMSAGLRF